MLEKSGYCGTVKWEITDEGTLLLIPKVGKTGVLPGYYEFYEVPWHHLKHLVHKIEIHGHIKTGKSCGCLFYGMTELKAVDLTGFDAKDAVTMYGMFARCTKLKTIVFPKMNTKKVKDMSYMFTGDDSLEEADLSNLDFGTVTDRRRMFANCQKLKKIIVQRRTDFPRVDTQETFAGCTGALIEKEAD